MCTLTSECLQQILPSINEPYGPELDMNTICTIGNDPIMECRKQNRRLTIYIIHAACLTVKNNTVTIEENSRIPKLACRHGSHVAWSTMSNSKAVDRSMDLGIKDLRAARPEEWPTPTASKGFLTRTRQHRWLLVDECHVLQHLLRNEAFMQLKATG